VGVWDPVSLASGLVEGQWYSFLLAAEKTPGPCAVNGFSIDLILPAVLGPGVYSASNRNEYQKERNNLSEE
jgi:hypothetical protein